MPSAASPGPADAAPRPSHRDGALDALRGLVVLGMLLVNLQGSFTAAYPILVHAAWDGVTIADLVFPFFLVVVGLSAALAIDPAAPPATAALLRRVAVLLLVGIGLNWLLQPALPLADLRLTGVLQRIALVYLVCALVAGTSRGPAAALLAATALLVLHGALLLLVPAPGEVAASLAPGAGIAGWADQAWLPGRAHRGTYDPEGVLSTLSAMATGLLGVAAVRLLSAGPVPRRTRPPGPALLLALAALAAGALATLILPLNKTLWTPSFALVTGAGGILCWLGLRRIWSRIGDQGWARAAVVLGRTALTLYVVHMLLIALLIRPLPDGTRLWAWLFQRLTDTGMPGAPAALLFAVAATALCAAAMPALLRRGWLLRA